MVWRRRRGTSDRTLEQPGGLQQQEGGLAPTPVGQGLGFRISLGGQRVEGCEEFMVASCWMRVWNLGFGVQSLVVP